MSQRISFEILKLDILKRGHTFIQLSNPEHVMSGTLTAKCKNNHIFTVSARSYRNCRENKFGQKNGCPCCKKETAFQNLKNSRCQIISRKPKVMPKIVEQVKIRDSLLMNLIYSKKQIFSKITTKNQLLTFLKKEQNVYTDFILNKMDRNSSSLTPEYKLERHHILPKHAGGLNQAFNIIILTYEEHTEAHRLLYEVHGSDYDKSVFKMREGKTSEARSIISTENVNRIRINKRGFFDSKLQSRLGSLPKKPRKPFSKTEYSKIAFEKGMIWVNDTNVRIGIGPGAYESPIQVAEVLALCPQWSSPYLKLKTGFLATSKKKYHNTLCWGGEINFWVARFKNK